jgi:DNA-binding IclR family transcriptional regulator
MAIGGGPGPETTPPPAPPQYPIESVDNALRLLLLFAEQPRIRLTDASSYLGVASSTAHRLLAMLQYRGFVTQELPSRAYVPGGALGTIAAAVLRQTTVPARARPVLEGLNRELAETIHLGRLDGDQVRYLDAIESGQAVRVASRVGRLVPAHCTSTGKAMLSRLPAQALYELYPEPVLVGVTARSIRDRPRLERQLRTARRRGYAVSDGESEEGVVSVAVPVSGPDGALYGLNVSVPAQRMSPTTRSRVVTALVAAQARLGSVLG